MGKRSGENEETRTNEEVWKITNRKRKKRINKGR